MSHFFWKNEMDLTKGKLLYWYILKLDSRGKESEETRINLYHWIKLFLANEFYFELTDQTKSWLLSGASSNTLNSSRWNDEVIEIKDSGGRQRFSFFHEVRVQTSDFFVKIWTSQIDKSFSWSRDQIADFKLRRLKKYGNSRKKYSWVSFSPSHFIQIIEVLSTHSNQHNMATSATENLIGLPHAIEIFPNSSFRRFLEELCLIKSTFFTI